MDIGDVLMMIFSGFLGFGIPLLFWIGTLIFGIVMLRRGGGKPERFFITGAALNILGTIHRIPIGYFPIWLTGREYGSEAMRSITFGVGLFINIVSALGVMGLIYAFWLKFNNYKNDQLVSVNSK